jgi:hypothetical protein
MEHYDPCPSADPFAAALSSFASLIADLNAPAALTACHDTLEDMIKTRGREVQRLLLQGFLDLRERCERATLTALAPTRRADIFEGHSRLETGHERQLATVVGSVTVTRCALRTPGRAALHPADAALALPKERCSLGLRKLAVLEAVRGSFDTALEAVTRACGKVCGKRQLEALIRAAAVDIAAFYASHLPQPATPEVLLVLSVDGKGIVMRPEHLREHTRRAAEKAQHTFRTRLAGGEKPNRKRMATLACVYDADPAVRRPHDVIAPPGGRSGERTPRPGPKARAKWLTGSVDHDPAAVVAAAFDQAESRDPLHARPWIVLVDGACHQLDLIHAEAGRRGATIHVVLDIVHVLEKLWAASRCFHTATDPAAETWVGTHAAALLSGRAEDVITAIRAQGDQQLTHDQRAAADTACQYLQNKKDYLGYETALAQGWPIASGAIESAARHLIADRLAITGSRWSVPGAEAILTLRAVISNGDFDQYWQYHRTREIERVHPDADQHQFQLTI